MSRFLARLTNSVNVFSFSNMLQQTVTGSEPRVDSQDGGRTRPVQLFIPRYKLPIWHQRSARINLMKRQQTNKS